MIRYEALMLIRPDVSDEEYGNLEKAVTKVLEDGKAKISSFDKWGKYRLAYPVQKKNYGVYSLVRFEVNKEDQQKVLEEIATYFKIKAHEIVMRHVTKYLEPDAPKEYKKPEAITTEEVGARQERGSRFHGRVSADRDRSDRDRPRKPYVPRDRAAAQGQAVQPAVAPEQQAKEAAQEEPKAEA